MKVKEIAKDIARPAAQIGFRAASWLEHRFCREYQLRYSPTFLIGPPRSGTTLLYQVLTYSLDVAYFSYLTGRLRVHGAPAIPVFSAHLSEMLRLREKRRPDFSSYYGYGAGWGSPHEGLEMWEYWCSDHYLEENQLDARTQRDIYQAVAATERIHHRPFLNKDPKHSVRLRALNQIFPNALFVYCHRDPLAIAQSIFVARAIDFPYLPEIPKDPAALWFSAKPRQYHQIKDKSLIEQICEQVYYTEENIASDRARLPPDRFLDLEYEQLCADPRGEVERIRQFMSANGAPTSTIRTPPESFRASSGRRIDETAYQAMQSYLAQLSGGHTTSGITTTNDYTKRALPQCT